MFLFALAFLILDSAEESTQAYKDRKLRVERVLEDTTQVINALEYSITSLYPLQNDRYVLPHTIKLNGDTCNFGGKSHTGKEYDFMFAGPKEMCDRNSPLFKKAYRRLFVAPSMAYFAKSISQISSIYFISADKFIISSPKAFAQSIEGDTFDKIISTRPYWTRTVKLASHSDSAIYTGDYQDYMTGRRVVTITRAIYVDGKFKGVLAIDNNLNDLIQYNFAGYRLTEKQGHNSSDVFSFRYSKPVVVAGKETGLYLTVDEPRSVHIIHILEHDKPRLIALTCFYVLVLCILWFRYTQSAHARLKQLAMLDPMTNLLNRRGFEVKLKELPSSSYLAIAVFDIDDFKAINDNCGHNVGDDIICQVAKLLSNSLRQTDLIARFGGEEFVIAVTSESAELAHVILERVQSDMSSPEIRLCDDTVLQVTASGGAVIYPLAKVSDISQLWQEKGIIDADSLLYQAKKAGKNRIFIELGKRD
ncbi:sensor domain-containing diguanylate cyclase [Vibrio panuliri]|uniref:sensor domain-containing diguanylate cyclase n=2 Tax=Vibrio panuliri TaxID=1381081 RepID=UPI001FD3AED0|nr:sensor domain-containing diguanylate cyclase [Vibrio panuliri]